MACLAHDDWASDEEEFEQQLRERVYLIGDHPPPTTRPSRERQPVGSVAALMAEPRPQPAGVQPLVAPVVAQPAAARPVATQPAPTQAAATPANRSLQVAGTAGLPSAARVDAAVDAKMPEPEPDDEELLESMF